jgi:hypothetical protein
MKRLFIPTAAFFFLAFASCKKSECHECHYDDASGAEVELGEYCDDELESLEANGYNDNGAIRTVHCHGH